jgi:nucleotide-binding universal stress UspA family protein
MTRSAAALPRPFKSILCPVDFSDHSRVALRRAAALAMQSGARLAVLFVNDPLLAAASAGAYGRRTPAADTSLPELRQFVARALSPASRQASSVTCGVVLGPPAREITRWADQHRIDLIVMGTHGIGGARRVLFGSTTKGVLQHSQVPVLVVPVTTRAGRSSRQSARG